MADQLVISELVISEDEEEEGEMIDPVRVYISHEEEEEAMLSKFMPIELSCWSPRTTSDLWIFWSVEGEEEATSSVLEIQKQIKTLLCSFRGFLTDVLIQFWAPTATIVGGRLLLTTSQQPFALAYNYEDKHLIGYRKHCVGYTFSEGDGVIGRVFHNQLPEFSQKMNYYSLEEHPLRDLALSCKITRTWAFPVFQPSQQSCVGVLEFLFSEDIFPHITDFGRLCSAIEFAHYLQRSGLLTLGTLKIRELIQEGINHVAEADEIKHALHQVRAHGLSPASAWVRCKHTTSSTHGSNPNSSYHDSNASSRGDFVVYVPHSFPDDAHIRLKCCYFLELIIMRVGQGLIGKAFLSDKPYLCSDLTQLSMSQYPMKHIARDFGITGCVTICLQSIATGSRDYVLEFYLSQGMKDSKDLNNLLSSMLATLKRHLKRFEAVVGDPGDELFVEIDKFSIDSVFESLKTYPTIITEIQPGGLHNEGEVLQANFPGQKLAMEEFSNSGGNSVGPKQRGKAIAPGNNCLKKKSNIVLEEKRLEQKSKAYNQKDSSCSYETLKQSFGMKLEDAAESLGVSRSTFKRLCRNNDIERWPSPKRRKVPSLPLVPRQINEPIQGNVAPISDCGGKGPSSSDTPTDLAPKQAMSTMMVKATYKDEIIKFELPFSSRRMDLVEKVIVRLKLSEGTFSIKYLDNEGHYVKISCDEDLQVCMKDFSKLEGTAMKMIIQPLAITLIE